MIEFKKNAEDGYLKIKITGDATINFAGEIKNEILKIAGEKKVVLDLSEVQECDLSFVQILISLNNHLIKNNGTMKIIKENLPEKFTERVKICGFDRHAIFRDN